MQTLRQAHYSLCADEAVSARFFSKLVKSFDLVAIGGLPLVGKTKLASTLEKDPAWDYLIWNSTTLLQMISSKEKFDHKIFNYINEFQSKTFKSRFFDSGTKFIVEGWLSTPRQRTNLLSPNPGLRSCLLLLDMPDELIYHNFHDGYMGMSSITEFKVLIKQRREKFIWPKINEGWTKIIYLCPDKRGEQYMWRTTSGILHS